MLPLSARTSTVEVDGEAFDPRRTCVVFATVTDWAVPAHRRRVGITRSRRRGRASSARATTLRPGTRRAGDVRVEVRGAGPATRQVTNFMSPESFDGADQLMCVELLTPGGNWSSYPPHRHDDIDDCPVSERGDLLLPVGEVGGTGYSTSIGQGVPAPTRSTASVDVNVTVRDGDVFLVPRGYHGPCVAAPGYPLYYLNVLAGTGRPTIDGVL